MVNVNCTGGGGYFSDDVSATKAQVVKGKRTVTKDQSDEVTEGTMVEVGATDAQKSNAVANGNLYLCMTNGAHRTKNQTSGYPEVYIPLQTLRSTIGATDASKILTGTTIAGLAGTMVNRGAWSGTLTLSGQITIPQGWHNGSGKITRPYSTYNGGTFTPSASNQTIPTSGKILTGNVNCKADANLIASNLKHGVTIMGVGGTYQSPYFYGDGRNGQSIFGDKAIGYSWYGDTYDWNGKHDRNDWLYSGFDAASMTVTLRSHASVNLTHYGCVLVISNKAVDISKFSTMTWNITYWSDPFKYNYSSRGMNHVRWYIGLSTSCERKGESAEYSNGYPRHYLAGTQYQSDYGAGNSQRSENMQTISLQQDLTEAKAAGSSYYPFARFGFYRVTGYGDDSGGHNSVFCKINSITFS